ncbi:hypothetical protein EB796_011275 [Bugula neritina]|uniref:Uncharacterized protein n=1 Tax=Bugula neritina TaxID=10212 RepID=A0A7J7JXH7_BUGNE|nr:hypothetical protein EB796_011275 [Bugula neritina]
MASRRLNERLAKYNYLYEDTDQPNNSADDVPDTKISSPLDTAAPAEKLTNGNGSATSNGTGTSLDASTDRISKREAFFKSEAPSTKFDPSLRERDGKAEKQDKPLASKENGHGRFPGEECLAVDLTLTNHWKVTWGLLTCPTKFTESL